MSGLMGGSWKRASPSGHLRVPGRWAERCHHVGLVGTQPVGHLEPRQLPTRHLRCFEIDVVRYGIPDPEYEMMDIDDETVRMADVIGPRSRFDYEYDFGDSWHHEVVVEAVTPLDLVLKFGVCLDGERACPPEDVGGVHMFATVLEFRRHPEQAESPEYLHWLPPDFDPDAFDLAAVNAALQRIR
jgi:Plasmid pRiA4b ORF-3-like protein